MKEEKNAAKEAFDGTTLAQFLFGPGGRQAGALLLTLGIPRNASFGTKDGMNPGDEAQTPIGCIQAGDTRTNLVEPLCPDQERLCKGGVMSMSRRKQKEER